jgi:hypothetical protein
MGNSIKTTDNPSPSINEKASTDTEISPLPTIPPYEHSINEIPPPVDPSERINLDELIACQKKCAESQKKWEEDTKRLKKEKEERDKKDEMYKNVALTKDFLQQNIAKESWMEFQTPLTKHLTKDIHGFDILNFDLMEYGLKYSKYISSVKLNFVSKDFDDETINLILRNLRYTLTFDTYNLIFYGHLVQRENLLLSNNLENYIVLPQRIAKVYNHIDINILNITKILPILEKIEVKIFVSTVEFNEFAEGRINYKHCFEQYYERNDGTWNILNISDGGHSCIGYSLNMPINKEEEETKEEDEQEEDDEQEEHDEQEEEDL